MTKVANHTTVTTTVTTHTTKGEHSSDAKVSSPKEGSNHTTVVTTVTTHTYTSGGKAKSEEKENEPSTEDSDSSSANSPSSDEDSSVVEEKPVPKKVTVTTVKHTISSTNTPKDDDVDDFSDINVPETKPAPKKVTVTTLTHTSSRNTPKDEVADDFSDIDVTEKPTLVHKTRPHPTRKPAVVDDFSDLDVEPTKINKVVKVTPFENHMTAEEMRKQAENAHYRFSSSVNDNINGESQVRKEVRDGSKVNGMYSYDDGNFFRTVWYKADENGFVVVK